MNAIRIVRIAAIFFLIMFLMSMCTAGASLQEDLSVQELEALLGEDTIEKATVYSESNRVVLTFKDSEDSDVDTSPKEVIYPEAYEEELIKNIKESGIPLVADNEGVSALALIFNFLPIIIIVAVLVWFMRSARKNAGGGMQNTFGKAKVKNINKNAPKVTFQDVAGIDEAVEEVREVKDYLVNNEKYKAVGAKIPRGILFVGPPGTGKSLLAKAIAGESEVPFFSMSGSEFVEMFVGVGAARVRDLFEQAKAAAPAIIFIDEIDSLGSRAGGMGGNGAQEHNQTLNQMLVAMDGFDTSTNVIVIGATNRMDMMDPALLRPGRFDRKIIVGNPDKNGREAILKVHARGKPLSDDINLASIAEQTYGFAGADLANLINEAAILAVRNGKDTISHEDLEEAIHRSKIGLKNKRPMSDKDKRITAFHEAGHTLTGYVLKHSHPVNKVTIVSRGHAGGFTESLPEEESSYAEIEELKDRVVMMLGGRAAEKILLDGRYTSGASNDISVATDTLHQMITQLGMDDELGPMRYGRSQQGNYLGQSYTMQDKDYSEDIQKKIDERKLHALKISEKVATKILEHFKEALNALAEELLVKETLKREEIEEVFNRYDVPKNGITWEVSSNNIVMNF